jgi:hypothetical protein
MLSDIILEQKGKANVNRVLDVDLQSRKTTVTAIGRVRGLDVSIIITYWNMPRSDDEATTPRQTYYYGEGKGIISSLTRL